MRTRSALPPLLLLCCLAVNPLMPFASCQETASRFPTLEFRKWSGTINVPDPVAVSVDALGRVFATQTRRRKIQDLDIREHREWIADDVGLSSVEDKRRFFHRVLAIGGDEDQQSRHVEDWNHDGVHDWRDLTVVSEVIYRLVDSDDDGLADEISVFAEDFKTEVTGIAAGVLAFEDDIYATIAPDLWKLSDRDGDGRADTRESIAHGFGLHIAYGGHDMHGLAVGPDGKIYWSIGDKGINVTTSDGRNVAFPNQGGVMRCNPDGSDFEVFAHGLRNVQEVAFDQYGNLFGVDNDSDQPREKERFVYIVNQMDAGWRCNYQYRGDNYNPWTAERLWEMAGEDPQASQHAAYIVPPIRYYIDGPAGFKFNPGTALSPEYKDFFFITGAPNGNQHAFRVEYAGDSFAMVDEHQIGSGLAIVGLAFGPDGGLYGADWDGGYPLDEKGSIVRIDISAAESADLQKSPERREVRELLSAGLADRERAELLPLLGHADQRVRLAAQFSLVRLDAGDALAGVALRENADQLERLHALWGLGQLGRGGDTLARDVLGLLLKDKDSRIRGQAAKTYGELPKVNGSPLIDLLDDDDLHVRTLAGIALGRQPSAKAVESLLQQADGLSPTQHYLRHAIVTALATCASPEQLAAESQHENEMRRLCCVLGMRRQANEQVGGYLLDSSDWVATEAARAIHDDASIASALPQLAAALTERDSQSEAFTRRAINANFRVGDAMAFRRVLQFALGERRDEAMREEALEALAEWQTPPALDRVEGRRRDLAPDGRTIDREAFSAGLAPLTSSSNDRLRARTVAAARALEVPLPREVLRELATNDANAADIRLEALNSLATEPEGLLPILDQLLQSQLVVLQTRALELMCDQFPLQGLKEIQKALVDDSRLRVQQTGVACLPKLPNEGGLNLLEQLGNRLVDGSLPSTLALDVKEAIDQVPTLRQKLELSSKKFALCRDGGDAAVGEKVFRTHLQAQCSRCHRVGKSGSEIGPPLTTIARTRDADYLLRSIAQPSADIEAKYRSHMLLLASGQVVKGVIQSQDKDKTVIADSSGKLLTIDSDDIEDSSEQQTSLMPDMTEILSAREVRDLVAYLRSLK
jgi:quinoprotein glucose dehydrogenase